MSSEEEPGRRREAAERLTGLLGRVMGELPPGQSSLVPKLTREQIDRMIEISKEEQLRGDDLKRTTARYTFLLAFMTLLMVGVMSWLFLYFGKEEYIDKMVIALLGALAGSGFSLGLLFSGRRSSLTPPTGKSLL